MPFPCLQGFCKISPSRSWKCQFRIWTWSILPWKSSFVSIACPNCWQRSHNVLWVVFPQIAICWVPRLWRKKIVKNSLFQNGKFFNFSEKLIGIIPERTSAPVSTNSPIMSKVLLTGRLWSSTSWTMCCIPLIWLLRLDSSSLRASWRAISRSTWSSHLLRLSKFSPAWRNFSWTACYNYIQKQS